MSNAAPRFTLPAPLEGWQLALLLAIYLLVGTTGHLPWRGDDLTHLGPIHSILTNGNWLLPQIAGETYLGNPPLYYWLGALMAKLLGWLLPVHDAARLASSVLTAATLYWTGLAARRLYGKNAFTPAILLGMGSLGLVVHAHETQPMLAQLAGMALCYAGLSELAERPYRGGIQAGIGSGMAFLASGLSGAVLTLPVLVIAPLVCPNCRSRMVIYGIALGVALAILIGAGWLGALAIFHPGQISLWWNEELLSTQPVQSSLLSYGKLIQLLGWFAWPLWPIAGWAIWHNRRKLATPQLALPIIAGTLSLLLIAGTGSLRAASMLPLLPPLCLLAALGVESLRRGAANAFDWFGVMTFIFFALVVWLGWTALHFGWPPGLARQVAKIAPNFQGDGVAWSASIGALLSAALLLVPTLIQRTRLRGTTNWAIGMTLLWSLAVVLWQPWFAHTKNYQPVAAELRAVLAEQTPGCIKRMGVGDTQRAALDYFADIRTLPYQDPANCRLLLTYSSSGHSQRIPGEWTMLQERRLGAGRKAETFRLYRRD
jgi:4-amino-4-deoxy-L-arabinose transferase-like glycosyltransferase